MPTKNYPLCDSCAIGFHDLCVGSLSDIRCDVECTCMEKGCIFVRTVVNQDFGRKAGGTGRE